MSCIVKKSFSWIPLKLLKADVVQLGLSLAKDGIQFNFWEYASACVDNVYEDRLHITRICFNAGSVSAPWKLYLGMRSVVKNMRIRFEAVKSEASRSFSNSCSLHDPKRLESVRLALILSLFALGSKSEEWVGNKRLCNICSVVISLGVPSKYCIVYDLYVVQAIRWIMV